ncbi:type II secretion system protein [Heyndrickxia ginsengihumi]|uniref:Type II secretion system protein n=1 Tax=Heyndrickxia ginsengihumi TaxID=363870 RepID=A0A0A6XXM6_9BACI|nr:type II secretion system protein [Heyndrickxia ginsengihumi]KHD84847.1 hypothetical protein NG54_12980 [Heyndrickxia ginsengihumi]MBE6183761.1 type II secretion system protein [Bacillus sp. (in: firmicutes)]MCM3022779.1 type II secretion system GspH family protein [Heyndrickxia ginsengihumi]NEY20046.1 type II secretion system protein [Heyndrickxia ginsengihumi]
MSKNEDGFTLVEAVTAFAIVLLITTALFPLMLNILAQLEQSKKDMMASRLLYEHIEEWIRIGQRSSSSHQLVGNTDFIFNIDDQDKKACVDYEKRQICIQGSF